MTAEILQIAELPAVYDRRYSKTGQGVHWFED
jgi:hypothetical protein